MQELLYPDRVSGPSALNCCENQGYGLQIILNVGLHRLPGVKPIDKFLYKPRIRPLALLKQSDRQALTMILASPFLRRIVGKIFKPSAVENQRCVTTFGTDIFVGPSV